MTNTGAGQPVAPIEAPPLWLLVLITFSGTLAMHVFVPAMPEAGRALGVSASTMQLTITTYISGLAVGQLVYGPLSDRFGRRPMLVVGLLIYTVAGLVAALAPGAGTLIAARLAQSFGGCAGLALGRAMVRDTSAPTDAARRMALLNTMVTLGPGLAPIFGAVLADALGWRAIFWAMAALGVANLALALRRLPETGQRAAGLSTAALLRNYGQLLMSPAFLGYMIGGGCATTSLYGFLASAPFLFVDELHRPPHEVGAYLALTIAGTALGGLLASQLVRRMRIERLLLLASLVGWAGSVAFLLFVLAGRLSVLTTMVPIFVFAVGLGTASPMALTKAVGVNPKVIGSAAGLYGFGQMVVGAVCSALVGLGPDPALSTALVLAGAGLVGQVALGIAQMWERRVA